MAANGHPYTGRRTPTIHSINSNGDLDSEVLGSSVEFATYTVHIPPTPDNYPMNADISIDSSISDLKKAPTNHFHISATMKSNSDYGNDVNIMSPSNDFDSRDYGNGNASWGAGGDSSDGSDRASGGEETKMLVDKERKSLTMSVSVASSVIIPYRIFVLVRMLVLGLFIQWRIRHPNEDAIWLWATSVICEIWFAFSWLLDQLPKLFPINRVVDLEVLKEKFETPNENNPTGKSDLPCIDIFVATSDPEAEQVLVTANTVLSILAADYPVEKLSCYVSDDSGSLLTFEAIAEAASFANLWVPFCRKHKIEPRNPEAYFNLKKDPYKNKVQRRGFVRDRRRMKREYDEFKVRVNALSESIRRRSDAYNIHEEVKALKRWREGNDDEPIERLKVTKATWMADGTHWPGAWSIPAPQHAREDHPSILQVMLQIPSDEPVRGSMGNGNSIDLSEIDTRLPLLVYISREMRPGYDNNTKAGAMNALVRASAVMSNGPFILNLDCDHYVNNSKAMREGMCFMLDSDGSDIAYVQFPQRFEGIDPSDRYANHNTVFFDVNMRALDGVQGPVYVGTGCLFRRTALYGFDPKNLQIQYDPYNEEIDMPLVPKKYGNSSAFIESIRVAAFQGLPIADHSTVRNGRPPGALIAPRNLLDSSTIAEAVDVVSCWYEDKTEWGQTIGWIYGSLTVDVVTGYRMHERGWRSVYCVTKTDAFRDTAPINLTDRLHQVLQYATGCAEIFFSRNNAILAGPRLKLLQRIAYLNIGMQPFTSIFLTVYCFLPALSLFSNRFIVQSLNIMFLSYLLVMAMVLMTLTVLEIKWSGIALEEWWRNEQFWVIGGTSAHLTALLQGVLKTISGIDISLTRTSEPLLDDSEDEFSDLYIVKYTSLMILPCTIILINVVAIATGIAREIYNYEHEWSNLIGGVLLGFWVLAHLYPFAKGLMGRRGKTPTTVYIWSGLLAICISLLWVAISPPSGDQNN